MDHFQYREGRLAAEEVSLDGIADGLGTPFYCYASATIERHFRVFSGAFGGSEDFYEEIVTDPFDRVDRPNAETMAAQAAVTEDSWLEALSAWSFWAADPGARSGKPKYHKWLRRAQ